ncbi:hypothetical protein WICPIJ_009628 [Wickerhamomyces pijperi]|uniref:Pre-mRNA-splicing factor SPF27 n=1 Tax=Wickerhamomyces pijperi TaxID=599730 RepID=A0A9P8PML6_WICPI|nr:hypothetical protein WICPIJ_009628 [Wickerhamomyces pijperi]
MSVIYEPLDSLPYIDDDISDLQRTQIDDLISKELSTQDLTQLHPSITVTKPDISLIRNIKEDQILKEDFTLGGVDLQRYSSNLTNSETLQQTISYTYLQSQSMLLSLTHSPNQWLTTNSQLQQANSLLESETRTKRQKINEINDYRETKQLEVKPTLRYLEEQWEGSIQRNLDLGVELLRMRVEKE